MTKRLLLYYKAANFISKVNLVSELPWTIGHILRFWVEILYDLIKSRESCFYFCLFILN